MSRECPPEYPYCVRVSTKDKGLFESTHSTYCYSGSGHGFGNPGQIEPGWKNVCTHDNQQNLNDFFERNVEYQQQLEREREEEAKRFRLREEKEKREREAEEERQRVIEQKKSAILQSKRQLDSKQNVTNMLAFLNSLIIEEADIEILKQLNFHRGEENVRMISNYISFLCSQFKSSGILKSFFFYLMT